MNSRPLIILRNLIIGKENSAKTATFWYLICNFLIRGFAFLTTPVFTRIMTTEDYGIVSTYNSCVALISIVVTLDLYSCIQISKKDFKKDNDAFVSSILFLSGTSVVVFYFLSKLYIWVFGNPLSIPDRLIDIMFLNILFENAFTIMQTYQRTYFKYKEFVVCTFLYSFVSLFLSLILVLNMGANKYWWRIIGTTIPTIVVGSYSMIRYFIKGRSFFDLKYWKYGLIYSIPLIAHHISGSVLSSSDRIMINSICGATDVGLYSLAYNIAAILSVVWISFTGAWSPWFFDKIENNCIPEIKKYVKPYVLIFCMFVVSAMLIGPEIVKILGPEAYWNSKWVIPPVCLGIYFQLLYSLYSNIEMYNKKTKLVAIGSIGAAVLNVILNLIFIKLFGYVAASYTTLCGYIALFTFHYFSSMRIDDRDLFGKPFIIKITCFMILFTAICTYLYSYIFLRYIFIFLMLAIAFCMYRKSIKEIIREIVK